MHKSDTKDKLFWLIERTTIWNERDVAGVYVEQMGIHGVLLVVDN